MGNGTRIFARGIQKFKNALLHIMTGIRNQCLGNHKQSIRKCLNTQLTAACTIETVMVMAMVHTLVW